MSLLRGIEAVEPCADAVGHLVCAAGFYPEGQKDMGNRIPYSVGRVPLGAKLPKRVMHPAAETQQPLGLGSASPRVPVPLVWRDSLEDLDNTT